MLGAIESLIQLLDNTERSERSERGEGDAIPTHSNGRLETQLASLSRQPSLTESPAAAGQRSRPLRDKRSARRTAKVRFAHSLHSAQPSGSVQPASATPSAPQPPASAGRSYAQPDGTQGPQSQAEQSTPAAMTSNHFVRGFVAYVCTLLGVAACLLISVVSVRRTLVAQAS